MSYTLIAVVALDATTPREAKRLANKVYEGIWDCMPEYPRPPTTIVLFNDVVSVPFKSEARRPNKKGGRDDDAK